MYDEKYYKTGNYLSYLDKEEKYQKLAEELIDISRKLNLINKESTFLDYGCAVGFLIKGIKKLGYENIFGYDISDWARSELIRKKLNVLDMSKKVNRKYNFDMSFFLDVLEHMSDEDIRSVFEKINSNVIIVRIPVSTNEGKTFHLKVSNNDPTHINCKSKQNWLELLKSLGYNFYHELDMTSIYSTEGVFCAILFRNESIK